MTQYKQIHLYSKTQNENAVMSNQGIAESCKCICVHERVQKVINKETNINLKRIVNPCYPPLQ